ncbi:NACHT domain-containing NTPase [Saccharothrix sp. HUAS TT1]|uniref:NACHT domain-containing protein n=1 Tax=unclassified Saccharothrix TaxID=2593673 RepID=UPI00345C516B
MTVQYDYESLGADRFQQLCQALLAAKLPDIQCFPVGMPDGGRDAALPAAPTSDSVVYQVKYRKPTPNRLATANEIEKWVINALNGELEKVRVLASRGTNKYILLTNAQCSSHQDEGTRDRVQKWLNENMPVSAQVWWRDDIDRRLDSEREIKRTYGFLRDTVGLAELLDLRQPNIDDDEFLKIARSDPRVNALTKYLAHQYRRDRVVKFKQAELEPQLLDVFIDVPLVVPPQSKIDDPAVRNILNSDWHTARSLNDTLERWSGILGRDVTETFIATNRAEGPLAATCLLAEGFRSDSGAEFLKFVLEGAPGQGKSTIGQYLCQVHRARLLNTPEVKRFPPEHRSSPIFLPLHVDLRDLAAWLRKQDPFDITFKGTPPDWSNTLESFLAAQVRRQSGGMLFTVTDLDSILRATPALLVLDGLDEVPDLNDRRAVVSCVNEALARIEPFSPSFRTIATSRPSSFAKTPGFSKKEYVYLTLGDLPLASVLEYTDGWLKSRNVAHQAAYEIRQVLGQRLGQPHIIDLARNPMQLAILLWLVRKKGLSLPDKRTALYRDYMETFLDREAEKSPIVRDERELILDLHGYVAWELHCLAESGESNGSISEIKLKGMLKGYLQTHGYKKKKIDLVDQLFTGMTDRVMVLTSRVENTFEFEVQPLREYFAAKYLYSTARNSTQGAERSGNRSDRFDALIRNPYWWNVARFYAGFSDVGELSNIADLLEDLVQPGQDFSLISYSRQAALSLLRDQVFSQKPRAQARVVELICSEDAVSLLAVANENLSISADSGGDEVVEKMIARIERQASSGIAEYASAQMLSANLGSAELASWWYQRWSSASSPLVRRRWLALGNTMRVIRVLPAEQVSQVIEHIGDDVLSWHLLLNQVNVTRITIDDNSFPSFLNAFRSGVSLDAPVSYNSITPTIGLLSMTSLSYVSYYVQNGRHRINSRRWSEKRPDTEVVRLIYRISDAYQAFNASDARNSIGSWIGLNALVEEALGGRCKRSLAMAAVAGEVRSGNLPRSQFCDLLDQSISPVQRARYARQRRNSVEWWSEQLRSITSVDDAFFALSCILQWAPNSVLWDNRSVLAPWVNQMDVYSLRTLHSLRSPYMVHAITQSNWNSSRASAPMLYLASAKLASEDAMVVLAKVARQRRDRELAGLAAIAWLQRMAFTRGSWSEESVNDLAEAYTIVRRSTTHFSLFTTDQRLNLVIARAILQRARELPPGVVMSASESLTADLGRRTPSLASVAAKGDWYDLDGES